MGALLDLLAGAGLPPQGFPGDTPVVLAARDPEGWVMGGVALEIHGEAGLHSVSLLTETAADYFPRFGFARVTRDRLPPSLGACRELRGACPDSAVVMILEAPASTPGT